MENIDIEKIMKEIRDDIQKRQLDSSVLSFEDVEMPNLTNLPNYKVFNYDTLDEILSFMSTHYNVSTDVLLMQSGGIRGKAALAVKKVVRKCLIPVMEGQNEFNASSTKGLSMLLCFVRESLKDKERIDELEQTVSELRSQVRRLEEERDR